MSDCGLFRWCFSWLLSCFVIYHGSICYLTTEAGSFWSRKWQPASVFLPGKLHGGKSLVGCSPWGRKNRIKRSAAQQAHLIRESVSRRPFGQKPCCLLASHTGVWLGVWKRECFITLQLNLSCLLSLFSILCPSWEFLQ